MRNLRVTAVRRSAFFFAIALLATARPTFGQTRTGQVFVFVTADKTPVAGVTVASGNSNNTTDRSGQAAFTLPTGRRTLRVTSAGFLPESLVVNVGPGMMTRANVVLRRQLPPRAVASSHAAAPSRAAAPANAAAQSNAAAPSNAVTPPQAEIPPDETMMSDAPVVTTKRGVRRARLAPTGVQVADRNAIDEQLDRSPGALSDVLSRVDGVRAQRLSAGSAGTSVRIGGLPGRYTKILLDGLPLFGATSEGLELIQTPALGVERVDIVKGGMSARYGPTAIAGVVNIESAPPTSPSEVAVSGASTVGSNLGMGSDVGIWQTHTFNPKWSASLVAGRH